MIGRSWSHAMEITGVTQGQTPRRKTMFECDERGRSHHRRLAGPAEKRILDREAKSVVIKRMKGQGVLRRREREDPRGRGSLGLTLEEHITNVSDSCGSERRRHRTPRETL